MNEENNSPLNSLLKFASIFLIFYIIYKWWTGKSEYAKGVASIKEAQRLCAEYDQKRIRNDIAEDKFQRDLKRATWVFDTPRQ